MAVDFSCVALLNRRNRHFATTWTSSGNTRPHQNKICVSVAVIAPCNNWIMTTYWISFHVRYIFIDLICSKSKMQLLDFNIMTVPCLLQYFTLNRRLWRTRKSCSRFPESLSVWVQIRNESSSWHNNWQCMETRTTAKYLMWHLNYML